MGYETISDICQNVAWIVNCPALTEYCKEKSEDGITPGFKLSNWIFSEEVGNIGLKKRLYADKFSKNDKVIYLVNTSEYAMVGEFDFVVFSDDKKSVFEFLEDIGLPGTVIEDIDTVNQTL